MPKITLKNKAVYHYEIKGEGEPVLFLHGSGVCWRFWEPQFESISKHYQMILPDMRGHGESTKWFPNDVYSMYVIAEDLLYFLDELNIHSIPVIGVSQGGVVAQLLAYQHPKRVSKLIVSNSWSEMPTKTAPWVVKLSNWVFAKLSDETIMKLMLKVYKKDDYTKRLIKDTYTFDREMLFKFKTSEFPAHTDQLHFISSPTLIMAGDKKPFLGIDEVKGGSTLFNHIPLATLAIFKGAFDPISTMRKDIFNEMVLNFLGEESLKTFEGVRYVTKN